MFYTTSRGGQWDEDLSGGKEGSTTDTTDDTTVNTFDDDEQNAEVCILFVENERIRNVLITFQNNAGEQRYDFRNANCNGRHNIFSFH